MITLIAESKTMSGIEKPITSELLSCNTPFLQSLANQTISYIKSLTISHIAEKLKISTSLARKVVKLIYNFDFTTTGNTAIESFTGDVFKALDINSLSENAKIRLNQNLLIISSLYGLLRPLDIIKNYRLDFNVDCAPDDKNIIQYRNFKSKNFYPNTSLVFT